MKNPILFELAIALFIAGIAMLLTSKEFVKLLIGALMTIIGGAILWRSFLKKMF